MALVDKIREQFKQLLADYDALRKQYWRDGEWYSWPPEDEYIRIRTQGLNLIRLSCGEGSEHYLQLRRLAEDKGAAYASRFLHIVAGILEAALRDFEGDMLFDTELRVRAEVLDDFLSQAEHLAEQKLYVAATALGGAVLEDTLRKMCDRRGLSYPEITSIEPLNVLLVKADAYDKLLQKQVTAWADLRNKADHGRFEEVTAADSCDFLKWLRRFVTEHLRDSPALQP